MTDKKAEAAGNLTVGDAKVKMVKRHSEYQEPDVAANQLVTDENRFAGKNPYPPGTPQAQGWDYLKQLGK